MAEEEARNFALRDRTAKRSGFSQDNNQGKPL
jgi:hypothetical protein